MRGFFASIAVISIALGAVFGCESEPPKRDNPEGAFARLAPCVDRADTSCLMRELDRDSRWSIHSIHRTLAETRKIVERSYPADEGARRKAFGRWFEESAARDPEGMFEIYCAKRRCLHDLARGFGAVAETRPEGEGAVALRTARGGEYVMLAVEGEWGLATWRDELVDAKIRLADNLKQVRLNAAAYEEQRVATGGGGKGE